MALMAGDVPILDVGVGPHVATSTCPVSSSHLWAAPAVARTSSGFTTSARRLDGVWESALANMELYLALREKARAFRADPRVEEALADAEVADLARPTLNDGESYQQLLADPSAFETFDIEAARTKGYGFARIQRYALEHLLGVR